MMCTVLDYLERTRERFPKNVICDDGTELLRFDEFVARARAIGTRLARGGVRRRAVAVFMENTAASWATMFGAVYSGNFYVVIDAKMPIARIRDIFRRLSPMAVIVDEATQAQAEKFDGVDVLPYGEAVQTETDEALLESVRRGMLDTDPLYAMFTSGSTGSPKGVVISHDSVIKYLSWYDETFEVDEHTVIGNQAPFYFGIAVSTMYSAVFTGARLVVVPRQLFSFPLKLAEFLQEKKVSMVYWVASGLKSIANFKVLDKMQLPYLKKILFAGEVLPTKQYNYLKSHLSSDAMFANLYGPTEAIDTVTCYVVNREFSDDEPLPLGHACTNCRLMVLREDDTLISPEDADEVGELCVLGSYLALGYYNDAERTAAGFTQNPMQDDFPERMYRTGDMVRYNGRGELVYVSRKDYQIKHQGYRIELGEIEAAVSAVKEVFECACIYDKKKELIVLYAAGENLTPRMVLDKTKDRLPRYMMPNKFFFFENLPHNQNGKVDKKKIQQLYEKG